MSQLYLVNFSVFRKILSDETEWNMCDKGKWVHFTTRMLMKFLENEEFLKTILDTKEATSFEMQIN